MLTLSRSWPSLDLGPCPLSGAPLHLSLHFALILGRDDCHLQAVFPKSWSLTSHSLQLKLAALFWSLSRSASVCVMIGSLHVHPPAPWLFTLLGHRGCLFSLVCASLLACLCCVCHRTQKGRSYSEGMFLKGKRRVVPHGSSEHSAVLLLARGTCMSVLTLLKQLWG